MNRITKSEITLKQGSEIILETLIQQGIKVVFGYPGGCVIPLFDAMLNYPDISFYLVRHEQGATHAADGLARVTGKAQVVFATSGPGATNCITGLATALMDSIPMVVITGQVRREVIGTDAFQETNVYGISRPVSKYNYIVKDIKDLQYIIQEAFFIANTGRKGPVLIDIPKDIQTEKFIFDKNLKVTSIRGYQSSFPPDKNLVIDAWEMISKSKKPLIYAGNGMNSVKSSKLLHEFVKKTNIPVATTLLGQGIYSGENKLGLGMLGMHGTYAANMATTECDLCIVLGARFDDRVTGNVETFLAQSKIIHVDIDPRSLGKIKIPDIAILADSSKFLEEINKIAKPIENQQWINKLSTWKKDYPPPNYYKYEGGENKIRPEYILKELSKQTSGNAYIVTDVGQHQMFTSLHYKFNRPIGHITSGGLGTMGFSLPAAAGIATLIDDYPIISISGDGGFQMCMQELATIRSYNLNVKIFIFNNSNLGMVKQWQDFFWESRYASTIFDFNPSFDMISSSYDIPNFVVRQRYEVPAVIKSVLASKGPILVEFKIDPEANVYPMIPPNSDIKDIKIGKNPS